MLEHGLERLCDTHSGWGPVGKNNDRESVDFTGSRELDLASVRSLAGSLC